MRQRILDRDTVMRLMGQEGMTVKDIAERYGCCIATVRNTIRVKPNPDEAYRPGPATYEDELNARKYAQRSNPTKVELDVRVVETTVTGKVGHYTVRDGEVRLGIDRVAVEDLVELSIELAQLAKLIERDGIGGNDR